MFSSTALHPRTVALLSREQYVQRTPEWYAIRRELLTASDAASALDIKPYPSYRGSSRMELMRKKLDNAPIDNMFVANIPLRMVAGVIDTQFGPVIAVFHNYAYLGRGKTFHSTLQLASHYNNVND